LAPIAAQADSQRFAMATLCAHVPGASTASRRSSGRVGSASSSNVRSVVMRVADSASGSMTIATDVLPSATTMPASALEKVASTLQPNVRPAPTAASAYAATITPSVT
jgi:hypothetical protein